MNSHIDLLTTLQINYPLPPSGGWAASSDFLHIIALKITDKKPKLILECGSGISTVIAGYLLKKLDYDGKIISIEQNKEYAVKNRELIKLHGLENFVQIVYEPLEEHKFGSNELIWYNLSFINGLEQKIQMIIVDGPINNGKSLARYPVVPLLKDNCTSNAIVILDDYNRIEEKKTVELWMRDVPSFKLETFKTEKGVAILTREN